MRNQTNSIAEEDTYHSHLVQTKSFHDEPLGPHHLRDFLLLQLKQASFLEKPQFRMNTVIDEPALKYLFIFVLYQSEVEPMEWIQVFISVRAVERSTLVMITTSVVPDSFPRL